MPTRERRKGTGLSLYRSYSAYRLRLCRHASALRTQYYRVSPIVFRHQHDNYILTQLPVYAYLLKDVGDSQSPCSSSRPLPGARVS